MSKLYGYLESERTKQVTRAGEHNIKSILQTSFVRVVTLMDKEGITTITTYECHGNDNVGDMLSMVRIDPDGMPYILDKW